MAVDGGYESDVAQQIIEWYKVWCAFKCVRSVSYIEYLNLARPPAGYTELENDGHPACGLGSRVLACANFVNKLLGCPFEIDVALVKH